MFSKRAAKQYAYDLASDGKVCFNQLNREEAEILTGMLLEATPQLHAYEYISDADFKCELPYMLAKLMRQNGKQEIDKDIIEFMKENAVRSMSIQIDELLKEEEKNYLFDKEIDDGA